MTQVTPDALETAINNPVSQSTAGYAAPSDNSDSFNNAVNEAYGMPSNVPAPKPDPFLQALIKSGEKPVKVAQNAIPPTAPIPYKPTGEQAHYLAQQKRPQIMVGAIKAPDTAANRAAEHNYSLRQEELIRQDQLQARQDDSNVGSAEAFTRSAAGVLTAGNSDRIADNPQTRYIMRHHQTAQLLGGLTGAAIGMFADPMSFLGDAEDIPLAYRMGKNALLGAGIMTSNDVNQQLAYNAKKTPYNYGETLGAAASGAAFGAGIPLVNEGVDAAEPSVGNVLRKYAGSAHEAAVERSLAAGKVASKIAGHAAVGAISSPTQPLVGAGQAVLLGGTGQEEPKPEPTPEPEPVIAPNRSLVNRMGASPELKNDPYAKAVSDAVYAQHSQQIRTLHTTAQNLLNSDDPRVQGIARILEDTHQSAMGQTPDFKAEQGALEKMTPEELSDVAAKVGTNDDSPDGIIAAQIRNQLLKTPTTEIKEIAKQNGVPDDGDRNSTVGRLIKMGSALKVEFAPPKPSDVTPDTLEVHESLIAANKAVDDAKIIPSTVQAQGEDDAHYQARKAQVSLWNRAVELAKSGDAATKVEAHKVLAKMVANGIGGNTAVHSRHTEMGEAGEIASQQPAGAVHKDGNDFVVTKATPMAPPDSFTKEEAQAEAAKTGGTAYDHGDGRWGVAHEVTAATATPEPKAAAAAKPEPKAAAAAKPEPKPADTPIAYDKLNSEGKSLVDGYLKSHPDVSKEKLTQGDLDEARKSGTPQKTFLSRMAPGADKVKVSDLKNGETISVDGEPYTAKLKGKNLHLSTPDGVEFAVPKGRALYRDPDAFDKAVADVPTDKEINKHAAKMQRRGKSQRPRPNAAATRILNHYRDTIKNPELDALRERVANKQAGFHPEDLDLMSPEQKRLAAPFVNEDGNFVNSPHDEHLLQMAIESPEQELESALKVADPESLDSLMARTSGTGAKTRINANKILSGSQMQIGGRSYTLIHSGVEGYEPGADDEEGGSYLLDDKSGQKYPINPDEELPIDRGVPIKSPEEASPVMFRGTGAKAAGDTVDQRTPPTEENLNKIANEGLAVKKDDPTTIDGLADKLNQGRAAIVHTFAPHVTELGKKIDGIISKWHGRSQGLKNYAEHYMTKSQKMFEKLLAKDPTASDRFYDYYESGTPPHPDELKFFQATSKIIHNVDENVVAYIRSVKGQGWSQWRNYFAHMAKEPEKAERQAQEYFARHPDDSFLGPRHTPTFAALRAMGIEPKYPNPIDASNAHIGTVVRWGAITGSRNDMDAGGYVTTDREKAEKLGWRIIKAWQKTVPESQSRIQENVDSNTWNALTATAKKLGIKIRTIPKINGGDGDNIGAFYSKGTGTAVRSAGTELSVLAHEIGHAVGVKMPDFLSNVLDDGPQNEVLPNGDVIPQTGYINNVQKEELGRLMAKVSDITEAARANRQEQLATLFEYWVGAKQMMQEIAPNLSERFKDELQKRGLTELLNHQTGVSLIKIHNPFVPIENWYGDNTTATMIERYSDQVVTQPLLKYAARGQSVINTLHVAVSCQHLVGTLQRFVSEPIGEAIDSAFGGHFAQALKQGTVELAKSPASLAEGWRVKNAILTRQGRPEDLKMGARLIDSGFTTNMGLGHEVWYSSVRRAAAGTPEDLKLAWAHAQRATDILMHPQSPYRAMLYQAAREGVLGLGRLDNALGRPAIAGAKGIYGLTKAFARKVYANAIPAAKAAALISRFREWDMAHPNEVMSNETMVDIRRFVDNKFGDRDAALMYLDKNLLACVRVTAAFPGWDIGLLNKYAIQPPREAARYIKFAAKKLTGNLSPDERAPSMKYLASAIASVGLTSMVGALITYGSSGKWPKTLYDAWKVKINGEWLSLLTNTKEVAAVVDAYHTDGLGGLAKAGVKMGVNKLGYIPHTVIHVGGNINYFGQEIMGPSHAYFDLAKYFVNSMNAYTFGNLENNMRHGMSFPKAFLLSQTMVSAPNTGTAAETLLKERYEQLHPTISHSPGTDKVLEAQREARIKYDDLVKHHADQASTFLDNAVKAGTFTARQAHEMVINGPLSSLQYYAKSLPIADVWGPFKRAHPEQKAAIRAVIQKRLETTRVLTHKQAEQYAKKFGVTIPTEVKADWAESEWRARVKANKGRPMRRSMMALKSYEYAKRYVDDYKKSHKGMSPPTNPLLQVYAKYGSPP